MKNFLESLPGFYNQVVLHHHTAITANVASAESIIINK